MENSKVMKIMLSVAIVFFLIMVGLGVFNIFKDKDEVEKLPQNDFINDVSNQESKKEYIPIEEISGDYTLTDAENENAFIVNKDNLPQNKSVINMFTDDLGDNKDSKIRIVMENSDSLLFVLDIETSGDNFVVTQNSRQMGEDIIQNTYPRSEYSFRDGVITLADGVELQMYSLVKGEFEETVDLFAYVIESLEVESGDEEKIIEISE